MFKVLVVEADPAVDWVQIFSGCEVQIEQAPWDGIRLDCSKGTGEFYCLEGSLRLLLRAAPPEHCHHPRMKDHRRFQPHLIVIRGAATMQTLTGMMLTTEPQMPWTH